MVQTPDRRRNRRYPICLNLRWRLIHRRKVLHTGDGATLNLSSGGILFDARRPLPANLPVELSIAWPILINNVVAMQLVVAGRIVRSAGHIVAIRIVRYEFRTLPRSAERQRVSSRGGTVGGQRW